MDECSSKWHSVIKNVSLCLLLFLLVCTIFSETFQGKQGENENIFFDYVGVSPTIQTQLNPVNLQCIVQHYDPSMNASVNITYPDEQYYVFPMNWSANGKFIFSSPFTIIGKYSFVIIVFNETKIVANSSSYSFWIALSKDDTDSDSMPDHWERRFGFNVTDPTDADLDEDGDGFSNAMEYTIGSHPLKNQVIINHLYRLKQEIDYFLLSFLCFIIISFCSLFGVRRGSTWL
ncbi:MAG: hypothetical protein R6U21_01995 [Thermoplasmatota archaeon]